jgi:peroxiredoxin
MFLRDSRKQLVSMVMMALLVVSVGVNVLQAKRIRTLVDPELPAPAVLGHQAPAIPALTPRGEPATIQFDGRPTLVYYFSPSCPWCERNWANVRALAAAANGRYRVVAITADTHLGAFAQTHALNFEVYGGVSAESREAYGFHGTPQTVVVSSQGIVSHSWTGVFIGRQARQIESLFGVTLPGVTAAPAGAAHTSPHD